MYILNKNLEFFKCVFEALTLKNFFVSFSFLSLSPSLPPSLSLARCVTQTMLQQFHSMSYLQTVPRQEIRCRQTSYTPHHLMNYNMLTHLWQNLLCKDRNVDDNFLNNIVRFSLPPHSLSLSLSISCIIQISCSLIRKMVSYVCYVYMNEIIIIIIIFTTKNMHIPVPLTSCHSCSLIRNTIPLIVPLCITPLLFKNQPAL